MAIWAYCGDGFDAGREFSDLLSTYNGDPDKSAGIVNGCFELTRIVDLGFIPRDAWQDAPDGLILFQDQKFRMAATVPGDGRMQTHDVSLVLSETFESRLEARRTEVSFLAVAGDRMRRGKAERWDDEL